MKDLKLGFIGAGNMAAALVKGLVQAKVMPPESILVSDVKAERLAHFADDYGVRATHDNHELVSTCDVIVLSVKPQVISWLRQRINSLPSWLF